MRPTDVEINACRQRIIVLAARAQLDDAGDPGEVTVYSAMIATLNWILGTSEDGPPDAWWEQWRPDVEPSEDL